jgi:hypothetical protein
MDGWRRFARVEARIKGEITKTWRENDVHLRRLTSMHIKNRLGLSRVYPGRPAGWTGFRRANSQAGFCLDLDRSHARVGQVPGRPAGLFQEL